ncbi:host-nuclease inhibitor Gam family protein [Cronobacter dublinensis]|uniref:host-nuclease inhibitor Gam family protein n=2 Tax=Cronobacter TaxID=413496 RepID=UPI0024C274EF|nr:host-nuclease inhibitor Gam family protein [Cronobacter dublinensis]MDK1194067.1 host-nuclease inhibitor Gam family protein [Cronobacter dublinensis]MDK1200925.1 host-nuclease inhibitor Gam family protein [Cronobacter dublinensis]HDI3023973.1 host-nuclease inhibitor protein [Cronobacter turicensis]HDI3034499.1 host-nuclease inhibitor protein [Cronobacter turicensis]
MNPYHMHDRTEETACQEHYSHVAREKEEAELADLYDRQIKFHHLHELLSHTQADAAAIKAAFDDVNFQEKAGAFIRYAAEVLAFNQTEINMELRRE